MTSSLLAIAPLATTVTVRGTAIPVYGVSLEGIAVLFSRFPSFESLLSGEQIDPAAIFKFGPDAVAAIIAAGTGAPGDPEAEAVAKTLAVSDQLALIVDIIKLTLPGGLVPFVENLRRAREALGLEEFNLDAS